MSTLKELFTTVFTDIYTNFHNYLLANNPGHNHGNNPIGEVISQNIKKVFVFDNESLSPNELTPSGDLKIGSGIPGDEGFYGTRKFGYENLEALKEKELTLEHSVGIQIAYRQSPEIVDGTGPLQNKFLMEGGSQLLGDHGASSTNVDRAKDQQNISIYSEDGDISDAWIAFDRNPTKLIDNIIFRPDETLGTMVATVDGVTVTGGTIIENPDGSVVIQMSHNRAFMDEFIDNDGFWFNGKQPYDFNHGEFAVSAGIDDISTIGFITVTPTDDVISM